MNRIAVTGGSSNDRLIVVKALSYMTGYDVVRSSPYSVQSIKYGLNKDLKSCEWDELFTYVLSSFTDRIEKECKYKTFISNGSVFNELCHLVVLTSALIEKNSTDFQSYIKSMSNTLKRVISEYAHNNYDCVIHIFDKELDMDTYQFQKDRCLMDLLKNCDTKCLVKNGNIQNALGDILKNSNILPLISLENAIALATDNILS